VKKSKSEKVKKGIEEIRLAFSLLDFFTFKVFLSQNPNVRCFYARQAQSAKNNKYILEEFF